MCSLGRTEWLVNKLESIFWLDPAARKSDLVDFVDALEDIIDAKGITPEIGSSVSMTIKALVKKSMFVVLWLYIMPGQQKILRKRQISLYGMRCSCAEIKFCTLSSFLEILPAC